MSGRSCTILGQLRRRLLPIVAGAGLALAGAAAPRGAGAEPATLVADSLRLVDGQTLVASGHVEVFYKGQRLQAEAIRYDHSRGQFQLSGPIRIEDPEGKVTLVAGAGDLSDDLRAGLLTSARLVMNEQVQLAAQQMLRVDGRYNVLRSVAVSSCKVCKGDPTPLWELRASRVVHDQDERQIYFDDASLRLAGLPVLYLPWLRIPDPTLRRTAGFLIPQLRSTSRQGLGLRMPYFLPIGPDKDVTVTPYVTTAGVTSVDLRYRQAYHFGTMELHGAVSADSGLGDRKLRGYVDGFGRFQLPAGYRLELRAEGVSDAAYYLDYGLPQRDRLESSATLNRMTRDRYFEARLSLFSSLREGDDNALLPSVVGDALWQNRFAFGPEGVAGLKAEIHGHYRYGQSPADGNGDGLADGRDLARFSLAGDWRRDWVLGPGLLVGVQGLVRTDFYGVWQDAGLQGTQLRPASGLALDLRWPLIRRSPVATEVIEPTVQLVWSHALNADKIANEDSRLVEFDEANLFSLTRFSGADVVEKGFRANLGLSYNRVTPDKQALRLAFGRVIAGELRTEFSAASGLSGLRSDWLTAASYDNGKGLASLGRLLLTEEGRLRKGELRLTMTGPWLDLAAGHTFVVADPAEGRATNLNELTLDAGYQIQPALRLKLDGRYDLDARQPAKAGIGLTFRNECIQVDLSLSRRYTSSTSVAPSTDFGLNVELLGFGGTGAAGPARACRG